MPNNPWSRAFLGLFGFAVAVLVSLVLTVLPPHWTVLQVAGVVVGTAGAFFVAGVTARSVLWRAGVGWLLAMACWASTLYGVADVALTVFGERRTCVVAEVDAVPTKTGSRQHTAALDCGGTGHQTVRGVSRPLAEGDRIEVLALQSGLVEPDLPERVSPIRAVLLLLLTTVALLGFVVQGAFRGSAGRF